MLDKLQKSLITIILASQLGHIFCCVLPTLLSVISLFAGLGILSSMPTGLATLHEMIHDYEISIMAASAVLLLFGWGVYMISRKIDCHDGEKACSHEPCAPKKDRAKLVLIVASILFLVNISVYIGFHEKAEDAAHSEEHQHHHNDHSDHAHE